tara:strand:- start:12185 stop:13297 length:1113 start_codon:yes stop_codon:yes gene_type:complete
MGKSKMVEIHEGIHPNLFEVKIIYPMLDALGRCVSGEYINAVEDWWLGKVQNDITWQRFQILPETQSVRYENQYMVERYFEYIKMQLPALTGTVFENLDVWQNPPLTLAKWLGETGLSPINKNDTTSWWRKLRTAEEKEANRHPNRSSRWIPSRLTDIKFQNTFYFGKPLTRTVDEWSEYTSMNEVVEKIVTKEENVPAEHERWKQYEYLAPFSYQHTTGNARTEIWLKNPNTMEYFERGEEKIDYDATASVYLQNNPSGEWEVCVVKFFDNPEEKVYRGENDYDFGQRYAAVLTFGTEDFNQRLTGEDEGVRLYPKSFRIQLAGADRYVNPSHLRKSSSKLDTFRELRVVNYYAPIANQYGMLNWYGSF